MPEEFKDDENFIRKMMGEAYLPRLMERTCLEIPVSDDAWIEEDEEKNSEE